MKRYFLGFSSVIPFLVAVLVQYTVANSLYLIFGHYSITADGSVSEEFTYLCSFAAVALCACIFILWYRLDTQGESRSNIKQLIHIPILVRMIILAIGCQFLFTGMIRLLSTYMVKVFTDYKSVLDHITSGKTILVVLLTVVIAPVCEELIFRGMVLRQANRYLSFIEANILQSLLFGIYHGNVVQGVYAAILGFLLGMVTNQYKSIVAAILLHMLINISAYLTYLIPEALLWNVIIMAAGGIITAIILIQWRVCTVKPKDKSY